MKRKICSAAIVAAILVSLISSISPVYAVSDEEATQAANALYELGLFNGTGVDANGNPIFDLERTPTRAEAVTMLVRLLGKGDEALNGNWEIPFTDVADWAKPYVGYAYENGLTSGTGATIFGGNDPVNATQYLTFILRVLGYESGKDFEWNAAWKLSDEIGVTNKEYNATTEKFTRGDVAVISYRALSLRKKGTSVNILGGIVESRVPDYLEVKGDSVLATIPFSSGTAYILDIMEFGDHKSPYIDALLEHGFETDVTYDRFFNRETGERVFLDYAIDSLNIVMFVSLDTEVSQSDYDNVMLSSHVISESRVKVSPVKFTNISAEMNSVGGWTFTFDVTNRSEKTIKYIIPYWHCYNRVGDVVYDKISRADRFSVKITGPIEPGQTWSNLQNERPFYHIQHRPLYQTLQTT